MSKDKTRVLVADDHPIVRKGICALLNANSKLDVIDEAEDGAMALEKCRKLLPDILLLDITMPHMTGLEVLRLVHEECPQTKVIMLTMHEDEDYFFQAIASGASGYVVKGASGEEIILAIQSVLKEGVYLHPSVAKNLVSDYLRNKKQSVFDGLTPREVEVLKLVADGFTNRQIAEELSISATTVQTHRAHVIEKLDLHNQAELIKYAIRKGILRADS